MLKYKCEWRGKNLIVINQFDPSSKLHNKCGYINQSLTLNDREWTCPRCNEVVHRDKNAAINIKRFGLLQERENSGMERTVVSEKELPSLTKIQQKKLVEMKPLASII
jgi:transposase